MFDIAKYFSGNCYLKFVPGEDENIVFPNSQDLRSQVPLTLAILILRFILRKYCFTPFGRWVKISDAKRKQVPRNEFLEAVYTNSKEIKHLTSIAKKVDMTKRQVERWWRLRRSQDKPATLIKFTENMWKGTFILCKFSFGLYALWDKEWLWEMDKITKILPNSGITSDIWWYYMISSAFYWSLTLTQFWDVRRKDFWQMFVHHIATIALLSFGWCGNIYRTGSVVLLLHDPSDFVLELGKAAKTARLGVTTLMFALFALIWVVTRLILFPYWVLTRTTEQAYVCNVPRIHLLNAMLWFLLVLHLIWTRVIFQVVYKSTTYSQEPQDLRSSSSESEALDRKPKEI